MAVAAGQSNGDDRRPLTGGARLPGRAHSASLRHPGILLSCGGGVGRPPWADGMGPRFTDLNWLGRVRRPGVGSGHRGHGDGPASARRPGLRVRGMRSP